MTNAHSEPRAEKGAGWLRRFARIFLPDESIPTNNPGLVPAAEITRFAISKVDLREGDMVILSTPDHLSLECARTISEEFKRHLGGGHKVAVLYGGLQVSVLSPAK